MRVTNVRPNLACFSSSSVENPNFTHALYILYMHIVYLYVHQVLYWCLLGLLISGPVVVVCDVTVDGLQTQVE